MDFVSSVLLSKAEKPGSTPTVPPAPRFLGTPTTSSCSTSTRWRSTVSFSRWQHRPRNRQKQSSTFHGDCPLCDTTVRPISGWIRHRGRWSQRSRGSARLAHPCGRSRDRRHGAVDCSVENLRRSCPVFPAWVPWLSLALLLRRVDISVFSHFRAGSSLYTCAFSPRQLGRCRDLGEERDLSHVPSD